MLKILTTILFFISSTSNAVPLPVELLQYKNANGTSFYATARGDEYMHYLMTESGVIVSLDRESGNYMVAKYNAINNSLEPSDINYPAILPYIFNVGLVIESPIKLENQVTSDNLGSIYKEAYDKLNTPAFPD